MKKGHKILNAVARATALACVGCALFAAVACGSTPQENNPPPAEENKYIGMKYADFAGEKWDEKTVKYQFLSDYNDGSNYRICANLYTDGSVASWQGVTLNSDDGNWVNEELHIRWDFYGYWSEEKTGDVTTLNIKISKDLDESGKPDYLSYECNDEMEAGVFELPEYACYSFGKIFNDGKGANTKRAVYCSGTVKYNTLNEFCASWVRDDFASA